MYILYAAKVYIIFKISAADKKSRGNHSFICALGILIDKRLTFTYSCTEHEKDFGRQTMASTLVQIRVDEDLKNEAVSIFERLGLDLPTAFRIFLKKSVEERGIPFSMKMNSEKTSLKKGMKAFNALRREAKKKGLQGMSLDEINAEIRAYRAGK